MDDFSIVMGRMEIVYNNYLRTHLKLDPKSITTTSKLIQETLLEPFEGNVLEGFNIYSLVNQLAAMLPETNEYISVFKDKSYYQFFEINTGNIEAKVEADLMRLYFPI